MDIRRLPIGKIIAIVIVLALVAAGVATFLSERQAKLEKAANTTAALKRAFSYDGEIYAYNSASDYWFLRKLGDDENYILLPGYLIGWSDIIEKFVYTEGKTVRLFTNSLIHVW